MITITLDFETYYSREYSLSKMTTEEYIRSPQFQVIGFSYKVDAGETVWVTGSDLHIATTLASLDIPSAYLVCHNVAFDGAILAWHYKLYPKFYIDTMSMARPITNATVGVSLAAIAKKFCLGEKGTEVVNALGVRREEFPPAQLASYGSYCCNDTELTYLAYKVLLQFSTLQELYIIDVMIRMFTDPVIQLDPLLLEEHLTAVQDKKELLLSKCAATPAILLSNPQFAELLGTLGVDPPRKISLATGKETWAFSKTDTEFKALLQHPSVEVQAVMGARFGLKSTLEETRTQGFLGVVDRGLLPILLNYYGAHTGRASGSDKLNLQNLPRGGKLRESMCAPVGHSLVAGDSAQIEARVVAWLAGEVDLVDAFANGVDIYSDFATVVYGRKIDRKREVVGNDGAVTLPDFTEGFVGKTCILGLGFGMGHVKFRDQLKSGHVRVDIEEDEAQRVVKLYRSKYTKIAQLWKDADEAIKCMARDQEFYLGVGVKLLCDGEGVHLPNGMIVRYNHLHFDAAQKSYVYKSRYDYVKLYGAKLIENVVQALARIVVFNQMANIDQKLRKYDTRENRFRVVLTVHDEVVAVVPTPLSDKFKVFMERAMAVTPKWAQGLPIACEVAVGDNYAQCK